MNNEVIFVREERDVSPLTGKERIYKMYQAPDKAAAKAFLESQNIDKPLLYIEVDTPDGKFCKDIEGMY